MRQLRFLIIWGLASCLTAGSVTAQIGLILKHVPGQKISDSDFLRGANEAIELWNKKSGVKKFSVMSQTASSIEEVTKAVGLLKKSGASVILADYLGSETLTQLRKSCASANLPCLAFQPGPKDVALAVKDFIVDRMRVNNLAVLSGKGKDAGKLKRLLKKNLVGFQDLAFQERLNCRGPKLAEKIFKERADAILLDGTPAEVQLAITNLREFIKVPVFLTPRSFTPGMQLPLTTYVLTGQSPFTHKAGVEFNAVFKEKYEADPQLGSGEGYDLVTYFLASTKGDAKKLPEVPKSFTLQGPRGEVGKADGKVVGALRSSMALWILKKGKTMALLPGPRDTGARAKNDMKKRVSVPRFGVPFGTDMSNRFELEPGTQQVLVGWGVPGQATIDDDLRLLGLSTQGKCPLADHLIKKELLGRMMAITSQKFLRLPSGKSRAGESFKISFATHLPLKAKKAGKWKVIIAGDDPEAGGRAFPGSGLALTFSTFLRRTIFQPKAIDPPLCAMDLPDLLGCATQDEFYDDSRALMIHALVDGYAGSMALTTAHEVGHLTGLGHITDDPHGIMNVKEGAGLGYREAGFSQGSKENLRRSLGIAEKPPQ